VFIYTHKHARTHTHTYVGNVKQTFTYLYTFIMYFNIKGMSPA